MSIAIFNQFTFFGSGYVLFLSALRFNKSQIGFLLSLLSFLGLLAIFVSPIIFRLGYKRSFINFWTARNLVVGLLVFTPWILARFGVGAVLLYVAAVVVVFAVFRTIAETAMLSWQQEYIPRAIQGKFFATSNIFVSLVSLLAVAVAGYVIGRSEGLNGFVLLFGAGVVFGLVSAWSFNHLPGGGKPLASGNANLAGLRAALRDRNYLFFLAGVAMIILGTVPLVSFLPLFMRDKVGLSTGSVVNLQMGTLVGGLLSSYLWGWTADRYGSKPVMLWGIYFLAVLPVLWFIMPRQTQWSFPFAIGIAFLQGTANLGWAVGLTRLFFVSVVPPEKKSDYMAIYYAWISIISGLSAQIGGWVLELSKGLSGNLGAFTIDSYSLLFLLGLLLPLAGVILFSSVRADTSLTTRQVAGVFLRGNPFMAMEALISFQSAKDERSAVSTTERLGKAGSPLTVDELLQTLEDPRFNVRFEAIVSIARRSPDDRLMGALVQVLQGSDPALSVIAAWAMGRIGDRRAIEPLRQGLSSEYRSIQGHCARALGTLGDKASGRYLQERLELEQDQGLQIAFGSALGILRERTAISRLLELLHASQDQTVRKELSLSLARMIGNEHYFIQLLRQLGEEPGAAISRAVSGLAKRLAKTSLQTPELLEQLEETAAAFAREDLDGGAALLRKDICQVQQEDLDSACRKVLQECAERLSELGASRMEYLLLALHTLNSEGLLNGKG